MTDPIKLPPDLLAVTLVREGVNKHRARDIECWMNEKMAQAVEQNTAELRAAVERLEQALENLVNRCNTEFVLAADPTVIAAEAALERLYRARAALKETK